MSGALDSAKFIPLEYKHAQQFAREFKVRWEWLLDGTRRAVADQAGRRAEEEAEREPPNHIRAWREYRGLTVAELAKKSGIGAQTINDLEFGADGYVRQVLNALADALDTTPGQPARPRPRTMSTRRYFETVQAIPKERRVPGAGDPEDLPALPAAALSLVTDRTNSNEGA